ncbi:hypothetical protein T4A_10784 [Trichinella pseudospiralis]|uniref:Uncharacterized protein n=1 Tax=Trichinella pseudospiralis TaxID=6337 RepID=A0A0V1DXF6_TRIPS|nr:hypothetical protein T4A_10784 [Trichinella pseudospiralis]
MGNHTAAYENKGPDVIQINWHCRNHANYLSNLATRGAVGSTPPVYIRERKLQNHSGKKLRLERSSVVRSSGPNVPVTVAECNGVVVPNQLSLSTSTSVDSGIWRASSVASH